MPLRMKVALLAALVTLSVPVRTPEPATAATNVEFAEKLIPICPPKDEDVMNDEPMPNDTVDNALTEPEFVRPSTLAVRPSDTVTVLAVSVSVLLVLNGLLAATIAFDPLMIVSPPKAEVAARVKVPPPESVTAFGKALAVAIVIPP